VPAADVRFETADVRIVSDDPALVTSDVNAVCSFVYEASSRVRETFKLATSTADLLATDSTADSAAKLIFDELSEADGM
jgi:hypothetical protein